MDIKEEGEPVKIKISKTKAAKARVKPVSKKKNTAKAMPKKVKIEEVSAESKLEFKPETPVGANTVDLKKIASGEKNLNIEAESILKNTISKSQNTDQPKIKTTLSVQANLKKFIRKFNASRSLKNNSTSKNVDAQISEEVISVKGRSIGLYKKIAFAFIFLTIILIAAVLYFSFVKVDIFLIPNQERLTNNLIFDIYDTAKNAEIKQGTIAGVVNEVTISDSKKFDASSSEIIGEEAVGKVTIINNYTKNQPLVASTRLISTDNKLFRMKDTVNVPAGGSIESEIYADVPSEAMAIAPTKFIFPGLWAGLQDKIYAESKESIVYQKQVKRKITQEDIDKAVKEMKDALLVKAKTDMGGMYKDFEQVIYNFDDNMVSILVDGKVGDEKDSFIVTIDAKVTVIAFNDEPIVNLAKEKILLTIAENMQLLDFDKSKIIYSLDSSNVEQGIATINATFEGRITLEDNAEVIDKEKIVGLTKDQLNEYLSSLSDIAGFDVKFSPSFIIKVPDLVDRINIEIKK